jgi:hypothetical protein
MNKYFLVKISILIFIALGFAFVIKIETSIAEITVELLPRWNKGEKQSLELVKSRKKTRGGKVVLETTARTDLDVEIIEANNDGYLLSWTYNETILDNPEQAQNPIIKQMSNLLKGHQIVFEVDSQGYINGVKNWKEMKKKSEEFLNIISKTLRESGLDKTTVDMLCNQVAAMFSTKEQIEMLSTRDAGLYFLPLGKSYMLASPFEYDDLLPNPFGGEPFPSKALLSLESHDVKKNRSIVKWKQTIIPEDAARILEKTFQDLSNRLGKPMPKEDELSTIDIKDYAEFTVIASSGWIEKFKHTRTIKIDASWQKDTSVIRMKGVK